MDPLDCNQGQQIVIHTRVQTTPNTRFCLRQWHASGFANHTKPESHFCTMSDRNGQWQETEQTYILFEGRFRLPATMVATETEIAHTDTVWFETKQRERVDARMIVGYHETAFFCLFNIWSTDNGSPSQCSKTAY